MLFLTIWLWLFGASTILAVIITPVLFIGLILFILALFLWWFCRLFVSPQR